MDVAALLTSIIDAFISLKTYKIILFGRKHLKYFIYKLLKLRKVCKMHVRKYQFEDNM